MQISCLHPRVIYHPHSRVLLSKYHYYTDGINTFHCSLAHYKPCDIPHETIDNYKIINPDTGETFPLFLLVRCNHCTLCRKRRVSQWSYRCIAEQRKSDGLNFFITLTYNNEHYPPSGLYKRDPQLFLKRLRMDIYRKLGKYINLRYICCGEYGKNTHRGHYHMNLFNVPKEYAPNLHTMLKRIERNWCIPTGEYNADGSPVVEPLGFAYCLPLSRGGIEYILKYMLKPQKIYEYEYERPFFTYSQGIGRDYIKSCSSVPYMALFDDYLSVPYGSLTIEETCFDIMRSRSVTRFHTDYTKNYLYPCESRLLTPFFRKYYKLALSAFNYARDFYNNMPKEYNVPFVLPKDFVEVTKSLNTFHLYDPNYYDKEHLSNDTFFRFNPFLTADASRSRYDQIYAVALMYMRNMLLEYDKSVNTLNKSLTLVKAKRMEILIARLKDIKPLNLDALVEQQNRIIRNYDRKDIF